MSEEVEKMKKIGCAFLFCALLLTGILFPFTDSFAVQSEALEVEKVYFHRFRQTNGDVIFDFYFNTDKIESSGDNYDIGREYISATSSTGTPEETFSGSQFAVGGEGAGQASNVVRIFVKYGTSEDIVSITLKKGFSAGGKTLREDFTIVFSEPVTMGMPSTAYQPDGRPDDRAWMPEAEKEGINSFGAVFMQFHYENDNPVYYVFGLYMAGDLSNPDPAWNENLNPYSTEFYGLKDGQPAVAHAVLDGFDRYYQKIVRLYVPIEDIDEITGFTVRAGLDIRTTDRELKEDVSFKVPQNIRIAKDENIGGEDADWIRLEYQFQSEYTNVLFYDIEKNLLRCDRIKRGTSVTPPVAPEVKGYRFIGWSVSDLDSIERPTHVYALYEPIEEKGGCGNLPSGGSGMLLLFGAAGLGVIRRFFR